MKVALSGMTAGVAFYVAQSGNVSDSSEKVARSLTPPMDPPLRASAMPVPLPERVVDSPANQGVPEQTAAPQYATGLGMELGRTGSLITLADVPKGVEAPPREGQTAGEVSPNVGGSGLPPSSGEQSSQPGTKDPPTEESGDPGTKGIEGGKQPGAKIRMGGTPSQNAVVNLINRLVQRGILAKEEADDLVRQAEADAEVALAQSNAIRGSVAQIAAAQAAAQVIERPELTEDALRIPFIPDVVKRDLREEIREDVLEKAKQEGWVGVNQVPDWTKRIRLFGDVRLRYDGSYFPKGNDVDAFPNFNAINTGSPYDVSDPTVPPPHLNVDKNRQRLRIRTRIGVEAQLGDGFSVGLRLATGQNNTPVSVNQSLGLANQGQGGNFSKYVVWLDRGFIKYEVTGGEGNVTSFLLGKFDNPFFGTEMTWDEDLGFDGIAVKGKYALDGGIKPFFAGGIFPVFNSDFNFASNHTGKFASYDKWLYALQLGAEIPIQNDWTAKAGVAVYQFDNVEGRTSKGYTPLNAQDAGETDESRPSFAQRGNTYFPLRNILPSALNDFGQSKLFQYFGLASGFKELAVTGQLDYAGFDPVHLTFTGEYVKNLDFDRASVASRAVNNREKTTDTITAKGAGDFKGGDQAWTANFRLGSPVLNKRGDWQVGMGYRYMESDAMVDAFVDSGFGLGGTNQQGYVIYGKVALSKSVSLGARWFSSREVAGPPLRVDVLQVDFGASF